LRPAFYRFFRSAPVTPNRTAPPTVANAGLGAGGLPSFTALSFDNMPGGVLGLP